MDKAEHVSRDLPTASLAPARAGATLSYSQQIPSEMPWVLRLIGCYVILQGMLPILRILPDIRHPMAWLTRWPNQYGLMVAAITILLGMGICARRRPAILIVLVLTVSQGLPTLLWLQNSTAVIAWLLQLPGATGRALVLLWVYQRTESRGVLVPARTDRQAAAGGDVLWFTRCVGLFLMLPLLQLLAQSLLGAVIGAERAGIAMVPMVSTVRVTAAAISAAVGTGLVFGYYRLLLFYAIATLAFSIGGPAVLRWDTARVAPYAMAMRTGAAWQYGLISLLISLATSGFYAALYFKARGQSESALPQIGRDDFTERIAHA